MEDPADVAFDPITIVLADDHALVRGGLHRILEAEDDFHVVAEVGDADEAVRITRELRPRIVLLDVTMPGTPSIDAIPSLLGAARGCAVVGDKKILTTLCPCGKERMRTLMELVRTGRLDIAKLITHRFPLERIEEAYDLFANQRDGVAKVAITP